MQKYALVVAKVLLTLVFLGAGGAKLAGVEQMVGTFDQLEFGQWFRHVTGLIEVVGAVLLWLRGMQVIGAGLLLCTMIGAVVAHVLVLGPSMLPAIVLGVLAGYVMWSYRAQAPGIKPS